MTDIKLLKAKLQNVQSWFSDKYQNLNSSLGFISLGRDLSKHFKQIGSIFTLILTIASLAQFSFMSVEAASPGPFWTWSGAGVPTKIPDSESFDKVFVGGVPWEAPTGDFYFASSGGDVLAWGRNNVGQLGDGTNTDLPTPTVVPALAGVTKIESGWTSSLGLRNDGSVLFWGNGVSTPFAVPGLSNITDIDFNPNAGIAIDSSGQVYDVAFNGGSSTLIPEVTNATQVKQGWLTKFALDSDGKVWAWGSNNYGQLGDGTIIDNPTPTIVAGLPSIKSISVGIEHILALDNNGDVWAWGRNLEEEIGQGASQPQTTPLKVLGLPPIGEIAAAGFGSKAVDFNQKIWEWGQGRTGGTSAIPTNLPNPANPSLFMLADPATLSSNGVTTVSKRNLIVQSTLKLTKTASVGIVTQGDTLTYTLNYENTSLVTATSVVLSDDLDAAFSFNSCSDSCTNTAQNVSWNLGDLAPGSIASVTLTVDVSPSAPVGKASNTAIMTATNAESSSATETIDIIAPENPDLNITKSASVTQASRNDTFDYNLNYSNTLLTSVDNVIITDTIDSRLSILSLPGACNQSGQYIDCNLGTLNSGDSGTLTITVSVNSDAAGGPLANTVIIDSDQTDPKSVGNLITINTPQSVGSNGAEISKTADITNASPGDTINYTISIKNDNPVQIDNFNITDTLDPRLNYNFNCSNSCNDYSNSIGNSYSSTSLSWSNISIASGDTVSLTYSVQVSSNASAGELWNTALVDYSQCFSFGCYQGNRSGSVKVDISDNGQSNQNPGNQEVTLTKIASVSQAQAGDSFSYTITATTQNYNGQLYFNDTLDSRLSFVGCSPDPGCIISGQNLSFSTFVSSFSSFSVVVDVVVNGGAATGLLTNTVNVDDLDSTQGSLEPKSATATIQIISSNAPAIQISKTSSQSVVNQGSNYTYTINYANIGNTSLSGVTIDDTLDSRLDFVSCSNGCTQSGQTFTWNIGTLNTGDVGSVTIDVAVKNNAAAGILANTAIISSNEVSPSSTVTYVRVDQPTSSVGISLTKTANVSNAVAGDQIVYTLQYANTGNVDLTGAVISDVLDTRLDFVSCSSSCVNSGQNVTWNLGSLAAGASTSVTVTVAVKAGAATGLLVNTGLFETNESAPASSSANVTIDSISVYEPLALTKTVSQNDLNRNSLFTYTLSYQNPNALIVSNAIITDTLDSRLSFVSCSDSCTQVGQDLTWNLGNLAANASGLVTVSVRVNNTAAYGLLANTGTIESTETTSQSAVVFASIRPINAISAPTLSKTVSNSSAQRSDALTYTINYSNNSDVNFTNAIITDTLDSRLSFVSCSDSCTQVGQDLTWNLGNLNIGDSGTLTINVTIQSNAALGLLVNTANINTSEATTVSAAAYTSVLINEVAPSSSLSVTKSSSANTVTSGDSLTYTINYTNGPTAVTNAVISDTLDARLAFVSCSDSCTQSGQTITWNLGSLGANASGSVTVTVNVANNAQVGGLGNVASIDSTETTSVNSNEVTVGVIAPVVADISIVKTASASTLKRGDTFTYTISYVNSNLPVNNVVITDTLDSRLTFQSCAGCTSAGQDLTWNIGALAANASGSVTVTVLVNNNASLGNLSNTAVIDSTETAPKSSQTAISIIIDDPTPILTIVASNTPNTINPGQSTTFTVNYTNQSTVAVTNASITTTLDPDLTLQSVCNGICSQSGQILTWNLGNLAVNANGSITFTVNSSAGTPAGLISTQFDIASTETATNSSNAALAIIPVLTVSNPNLAITKTASANTLNPGDNISYQINYSNPSTTNATTVSISDILNSNLSFVSCTGSCVQVGQNISWTIPSLAFGASGSFTLIVKINPNVSSNLIQNTATISATGFNPASSTASVAVVTPNTGGVRLTQNQTVFGSNLNVEKIADKKVAQSGEMIEFKIQYSNDGPSAVQNVIIDDSLSKYLEFVSCSQNCKVSNQNLKWEIPTLESGQKGAVTVQAKVKSLPTVLGVNSNNQSDDTSPKFVVEQSESKATIKGDGTIVESSTSAVAVFELTAGSKVTSKPVEIPTTNQILVRTGAAQSAGSYITYLIIELMLFGLVYMSVKEKKSDN